MATTPVQTQVLLVADTPNNESVRLEGQPSSGMGAWFIAIPAGKDVLTAAADWAKTQSFQIGTIVYVLDPTNAQKFILETNWVPVP